MKTIKIDEDLQSLFEEVGLKVSEAELNVYDKNTPLTSYMRRAYSLALIIKEIEAYVTEADYFCSNVGWSGSNAVKNGRIKMTFNTLSFTIALTVNKPIRVSAARVDTNEFLNLGALTKNVERGMEFLKFVTETAMVKVNTTIKELEDA